MTRDIVATPRAPQAVGPYSQAVRANGMLFVSGQLAIVPETGQLLSGGIRDQTHRVLENVRAILDEAELSLSNVVRTTIYLRRMLDFAAVNEAYAEFFPSSPPARACVEVSRLPKEADVMVECIAAYPE